MFTRIKRISCCESRMDARIENFLLRHQGFKLFLIYIGLPLFTMAAVGVCTTAAALSLAFLFGWM
ncbi:hypothetical protein B5G28_06285 [Faecalibacterium sp. An77]|uniref:hypothetical protein n=1 Tax=Faecalibacterium sp. An77 TaxID=1965655 RepID=UPI000B36581F|nr:hypothetical protein [Faecalibacterium sp. An77]OUN39137.1 hypothetical protein B5G28_06285 [Faecalibacterium sp. An77]